MKAGANGNYIGIESSDVGTINRINYDDKGAVPGSFAITVQGTNNLIANDRILLNESGSPSYTMQDLNFAPGNTYYTF